VRRKTRASKATSRNTRQTGSEQTQEMTPESPYLM
jgi:hypothetical protein